MSVSKIPNVQKGKNCTKNKFENSSTNQNYL